MTYRERTKLVCASILMIIKNATIIIPVVEGIIYTIIDLIHPQKENKNDGSAEKVTDVKATSEDDA